MFQTIKFKYLLLTGIINERKSSTARLNSATTDVWPKMFGKLMSIDRGIIVKYFECCFKCRNLLDYWQTRWHKPFIFIVKMSQRPIGREPGGTISQYNHICFIFFSFFVFNWIKLYNWLEKWQWLYQQLKFVKFRE